MVKNREGWQQLKQQLAAREKIAQAMGGEERVARQHGKGRLTARERIARLCDKQSFSEYGSLAGGNHPNGAAPLAADGVVGGTARINDRAVVIIAEDFTVKGGSIGHPNAAKRARLVRLASEQGMPLILLLDGAGERAENQAERYPNTPSDLQLVADLQGQVPVVTLVLGTSAGHGALTGVFADFMIMLEGAAMFTAGPPLVKAALGVDATPEQLGGAKMHTHDSGVAHNLVSNEEDAFTLARSYLGLVSEPFDATGTLGARRELQALLDIIPAQGSLGYDMQKVLVELVDRDSLLDLQPDFGRNIITAMARIGGHSCMIVANQPAVQAGTITTDAAHKAAHFIRVAHERKLPLVFLIDNPGVMPGPESEKSGVLRAAAEMFLAQRRYAGQKIVVTLRKAFGFGSSVMGMNPWDSQTISMALPSVSLGGMPAISGSDAAGADKETSAQIEAVQSGAWVPADAMAFDKVIAPEQLRNEIIDALDKSRRASPVRL
ncbi:MAG: carboxyl transferase [Pseudomonadales bacterium]|nr:carboxyl transferase [Pseudomonadales bacterium]